eukprot:NODE_14_length_51535_cov_1.125049.p22 type:complete len:312 gc:universal NODE_14_length_51535_cov_1.125049:4140-3205(-)
MKLCTEFNIPPDQFVPYYRKEKKYFLKFLMFAAKELKTSSKKIWTSLFEVSLQDKSLRHQLLEILQDPNALVDETEVLLLCHTHNYNDGKLVLLERMNMQKEIIYVYMDLEKHDKVLSSAIEHCQYDKDIWVEVLKYFAKTARKDKRHLDQALNIIEGSNILNCVEVVKILATDEENTMELIKGYLIRQFQNEADKIQEFIDMSQKFQQDIDQMTNEIKKIKNEPILFQETICSACQQQLNLPIVHFYCHHSYHQSCLGNSESCPRCIEEYESPIEEENETFFFKEIDNADDPFSKITEFFSRHSIATSPL